MGNGIINVLQKIDDWWVVRNHKKKNKNKNPSSTRMPGLTACSPSKKDDNPAIASPAGKITTNTPYIPVVINNDFYRTSTIKVNKRSYKTKNEGYHCIGLGGTSTAVRLDEGENQIKIGNHNLRVKYDPAFKTGNKSLLYQIAQWNYHPKGRSVAIIDEKTGKGLGLINPSVHYPYSLFVSPDSKEIFVLGSYGINVIDTNTHKIKKTISIPDKHIITGSAKLKFVKGKKLLYFVWRDKDDATRAQKISYLDLDTYKVTDVITKLDCTEKTYRSGSGYDHMALHPNNKKIYFACGNDGTDKLRVFDVASKKETGSISLNSWVGARGLGINPNGKWGVACGEHTTKSGFGKRLSTTIIFDASNDKEITRSLPGLWCNNIIFSTQEEKVFIGGSYQLISYNYSTRQTKWYKKSSSLHTGGVNSYGNVPIIDWPSGITGGPMQINSKGSKVNLFMKISGAHGSGPDKLPCLDIAEINPDNGNIVRHLIGASRGDGGSMVYKKAY